MKVRNRETKRGRIWIVACLLAFVLLVIAVSLYQSAYGLTCSEYEIYSDKIEQSVRVVQISDLHNSEFGEDNQKLIAMVKEQAPDLIVLTGDLLNSDEEDISIAIQLITDLSAVAPVYASLGNHEVAYQEERDVDLVSLYEQAGATVLDKQYIDTEINGQTLRIGGIYGYCTSEKMAQQGEGDVEDSAFLKEFQNTELYTLLMCHMPYAWLEADSLNQWDVDCIFSGHVHGGEMIFPIIGGLWAPDFGWFPGKLEGVYTSEDGEKILVLSRGLGTTEAVPRFNNVPEVVVVDLMPKQD